MLTRFGMVDINVVKNPIMPSSKLSKDKGGVRVDETLFKQVVKQVHVQSHYVTLACNNNNFKVFKMYNGSWYFL